MMKLNETNQSYVTPSVETCEIQIEKVIAGSVETTSIDDYTIDSDF